MPKYLLFLLAVSAFGQGQVGGVQQSASGSMTWPAAPGIAVYAGSQAWGTSLTPYIDVRAFGAKGDGATDDTATVQAALNASLNVYFPTGTYLVSNLTPQSNQRLFGAGISSILVYKPGATGYLIDGVGKALRLQDLSFDGGNSVDYSAGSFLAGTRSAIHIDVTQDDQVLDGISVHGFNNIGIGLNGDQTASHKGAVISNSFIYQNYIGIDSGPGGTNNDTGLAGANGGEYIKIVGNTISQSVYGLVVDSGNTTSVGNALSQNATCLFVNGDAGNGAHGTFTSNLCNHSTTNAVYVVDAQNGFTISDNQFYGGNWVMSGISSGILVSNNAISVGAMTLSGSGWYSFSNNWFASDTTFADTSLNTTWNGNQFKSSSLYVNNKAPLLVDPTAISATSTPGITGTQLVTNGNFSADSNWTKGAGWTISSAAAHAVNPAGNLSQNIGVLPQTKYLITWTIANYAGGSIGVAIGGAITMIQHSSNGTYADIMNSRAAVNGLLIFYGNNFSGDISNVTVYVYTSKGSLSLETLNANAFLPGIIYAAAGVALPSCASGIKGEQVVVSDATSPTYMGAYASGGGIAAAVICSYNGSAYSWLTH